MKPFYLYYLIDPTVQKIRYIGYSRDPDKRYIDHMLQSFNLKTHKECWIASLLQRDIYPTLKICCIVEGADEAKRVEVALIAMFNKRGFDLVNGTRGGDGSAGFKWSEENYQKHKTYWDTVGRQRHSDMKKGRPQTEAHRLAVMAANTPELLIRRGASIKAGWARRNGAPTKKKGHPSGRKPSLGKRWKMTDEQRQHQRESWTSERRAIHAERMRSKRNTKSPMTDIKHQIASEERKIAKLKLQL